MLNIKISFFFLKSLFALNNILIINLNLNKFLKKYINSINIKKLNTNKIVLIRSPFHYKNSKSLLNIPYYIIKTHVSLKSLKKFKIISCAKFKYTKFNIKKICNYSFFKKINVKY